MRDLIKRTDTKNLPARAGRFFTDLMYPRLCYKCKKPGSYLCQNCYETSGALPHSICPMCQARLPDGILSETCRRQAGLDRIFTCASYRQNTINMLIKDLKYKPAYALSEPLSAYVVWWLEREKYAEVIKENIDIIVPVPGYAKKIKKRGFNHAQKIAEHLSEYLEIPINPNILLKTKKTESQVEAGSRKNREENLAGAFTVGNISRTSVAGRTVLLVDDVVTTGSTMRECAKVLRKAGTREIWALAVAKD